MKKHNFILMLIVMTTTSFLFAGSINWHSMDELSENINSTEKLIYIMVCSSQDYFGKAFEENVLNDEAIMKTLNRNYYSVQFWATEDNSPYTFYGKTYKPKEKKHELLEAMSVISNFVPTHIFLDQRPSAHPEENDFNILTIVKGYIQKEDFLSLIQKYPSELAIESYIESTSLQEEVRAIVEAWDFNNNFAKIAEATRENYENIMGAAIYGGGLGGGSVNAWVSSVQFSGTDLEGTIHKSSYDGSYYAIFPLVTGGSEAPWNSVFKTALDILLKELPADDKNKMSWDINETEQTAQLTHIYEGFEYYIELAVRENEYDDNRIMELTFWGNLEK